MFAAYNTIVTLKIYQKVANTILIKFKNVRTFVLTVLATLPVRLAYQGESSIFYKL